MGPTVTTDPRTAQTCNPVLLTRRSALLGLASVLPLAAQAGPDPSAPPEGAVARNVSGFVTPRWQQHFSSTTGGMILIDTRSRALFFWSQDLRVQRLYPTSIPIREEYTRRGRTSIIRRVEGPDWRPTPSMLRRHPDWPTYLAPGPGNPMGTHALHLTWPAYRIHGTHDDNKIGRRSSNGCFGLYNHHIAELFHLVRIGTQVLVI